MLDNEITTIINIKKNNIINLKNLSFELKGNLKDKEYLIVNAIINDEERHIKELNNLKVKLNL